MRTLIILLLLCSTASAGDYVCHDFGIINERYWSVDGADLKVRADCIQITRRQYIELSEYHKVESGSLVLMSQAEIDAKDQAEVDAQTQLVTDRLTALDDDLVVDRSSLILTKADNAIDQIGSLADAKVFLKKLVRYIIANR